MSDSGFGKGYPHDCNLALGKRVDSNFICSGLYGFIKATTQSVAASGYLNTTLRNVCHILNMNTVIVSRK